MSVSGRETLFVYDGEGIVEKSFSDVAAMIRAMLPRATQVVVEPLLFFRPLDLFHSYRRIHPHAANPL